MFQDPADKVHFQCRSLEELISSVTFYRQSSGRAPGNPEKEITKALCKRCPTCCTGSDNDKGGQILSMMVAHHVHKAFMETGASGARALVSEEVAKQRAAICFQCKLRANWVTSCPPCGANAKPGIVAAVYPNKVLPDTEDFACEAALDSIAIAVFETDPKSAPGAPDGCWRKLD